MYNIEPKIFYDIGEFTNVVYYDAVFTKLFLRELVASDKFWYQLAHISSLRQVRMRVENNGVAFEVAFLLRGSPCAWMAIVLEDYPRGEAVYSTYTYFDGGSRHSKNAVFHTQTLPICRMFYRQMCTHLLDKTGQRQ